MTLDSVSYERLVAVRLQARYNDVFSSKRVLKFICLLVAGAANIGIVLTLLRTRRRVQPQHEQLREKIRRRRETKLTRTIVFVVGVYLLLNMPVLFVTIYHQILEKDIKTYNHYSWTETLAFLNSFTNPLICFWKSRQIRQAVIAINILK